MANAVQAVAKASRFGDFEFFPHVPELRKRGVRLKLEPKPLLVLCVLLETPGEVVSRGELQKRLWPQNTFVDFELGLNVAVRKLREALCDAADGPRYIETLIGSGYRFIGSVETAPVHAHPPAANQDAAVEIRPEIASEKAVPAAMIYTATDRPRRSWHIWAAGMLLFCLGAAGIAVFRWGIPHSAHSAIESSILVTSFDNRTGEAALDGTLETAFASELSNSHSIKVVPPERVGEILRLMRRPADTRVDSAIGREICLRDGNIKGMLTGRVERLGGDYRFTVLVVNPANGAIIASAEKQASSPERLVSSLHSIADSLGRRLGEQLAAIAEPSEHLAPVTTSSLEALKLYSHAIQRIEDGEANGDPNRFVDELTRAVQYDPQFASAHIELAWILSDLGHPAEGRRHLESAMQLSSGVSDQERLFIAGAYYGYKGDLNKSVIAYQEFLRRSPNDIDALLNLFSQTGQPELGYRAADLRPNNFGLNMTAWLIAVEKSDAPMQRKYYERSIALLDPNSLEDSPGASAVEFWPAMADLSRNDLPAVHTELKRLEASYETRGPHARNFFAGYLGQFYCYLGQFTMAEHWFSLTDPDHRKSGMAQLAYARGQPGARTQLRLAAADGDPNFVALLATLGDPKPAREFTQDGSRRVYYDIAQGIEKMSRGERNEGVAQLREALTIAWYTDQKLAAANLLANALEQQGDFAGAADALATIASSPGLPLLNIPVWATETRLHLAYLYRKLGRNSDADRIEHTFAILSSAADPDYLTASRRRVVNAVGSRWKSSRKHRTFHSHAAHSFVAQVTG